MIQSTITFNICSCLPVLSTSKIYQQFQQLQSPILVLFCGFTRAFFGHGMTLFTLFICHASDFFCGLNPGVIIFGKPALISWPDLFALIFYSQSTFADKYTSHYSILYYNYTCFCFLFGWQFIWGLPHHTVST